jgi:hypothetical protein
MRNVLTFLLHQFLSTVAVMFGSPIIVFSITSVLHIWAPDINNHTASSVLTTISGFPIQTMLASLFGFWLHKWTGQKAALWVWIIPALGMLILLVYGPVAEYGPHSGANVFSHFFGSGCKPEHRCFDQIIFTLPLCTSLAYSLGAAFAGFQKKTDEALSTAAPINLISASPTSECAE